MTRMKIVSGYPHGACSYYRSNGVFPKLDIDTALMQDVDWQSIANTDIVMVERPSDINFYNACCIIKDFGVKLWIDFDDNFFALPDWNQAKLHYDNPTNKGAIIKCMQMADVVTVTTETLKSVYSKYSDNIHVIPNAFNDFNYDFKKRLSSKKVILWRGSKTHSGDLYTKHPMTPDLKEKIIEESFKYEGTEREVRGKIIDKTIDSRISGLVQEIWRMARNKRTWKWEFIGEEIDEIVSPIDNKKVWKEQHIVNYFNTIRKINPSIYIVPLAFNTFNHAKSNCGWLEATYAGAATLAPDMPEFRKPGILNYKNQKEFYSLLDRLMEDEKLRADNYEKSFEYIKKNLLLSHVNKKRKKILDEVLNGK